jgi:hypothetical protein
MQFVSISASDAYTNLKRGKLISATKSIFDRRNFSSLKAVWEDRKWVGDVCERTRTEQKGRIATKMHASPGRKADGLGLSTEEPKSRSLWCAS